MMKIKRSSHIQALYNLSKDFNLLRQLGIERDYTCTPGMQSITKMARPLATSSLYGKSQRLPVLVVGFRCCQALPEYLNLLCSCCSIESAQLMRYMKSRKDSNSHARSHCFVDFKIRGRQNLQYIFRPISLCCLKRCWNYNPEFWQQTILWSFVCSKVWLYSRKQQDVCQNSFATLSFSGFPIMYKYIAVGDKSLHSKHRTNVANNTISLSDTVYNLIRIINSSCHPVIQPQAREE